MQKNYTEALDALDKAVQFNNSNHFAYFLKGMLTFFD